MKYLLIAGEPSGDLHASNLMRELKKLDSNAVFHFFGGDLMLEQGGVLVKHYNEMAFMGIIPVLLNLNKIKRNFEIFKNQVYDYKPDIVILIDYPGFNLRAAKIAKRAGIKVIYYISPKIWAWKTKRVYTIKALVDQMFTIFPFETDFYKKYGYNVEYVGNPIADIISDELKKNVDFEDFCIKNNLEKKPIIAMLAGSRKQEIKKLLPYYEGFAKLYPNYQCVIAGAPGIQPHYYKSIVKNQMPIVFNQTYALLRNSKVAIVASGTATLETALLKIPQVVVYRMDLGWWLERLRKYFLKTKYISLVNLVADNEVVKELFHSQVTVKNIYNEVDKILTDNEYRMVMYMNYSSIKDKLSSSGASAKVANSIVKNIDKNS